jgi:riboflavin biosynthesis pyrimidine reductase
LNGIPKIVFSKNGFDPKEILVAHGGTSFMQSLVETGLIDEYWLAIYPVVLGRGTIRSAIL